MLALGLVVLATAAVPASARTICRAQNAAPGVELRIDQGQVTLNNGHSREQLKTLPGQRRPPSALGAMWHPVGLTVTERQFSMRVQVRAVRVSQGRYCGHLTKATARIGYDKLIVYIARKYRPGSCHYRSILEHENRHVAVFRDTLAKYADRVERRLKRVAGELRPVLADTADKTAQLLQNALQRELKPLFREMDRETDRLNATLDTPQNYRREQARCNGW